MNGLDPPATMPQIAGMPDHTDDTTELERRLKDLELAESRAATRVMVTNGPQRGLP
jgi:hypothetical protein